MKEEVINLTEAEKQELKEVRDKIFQASVGYVEADRAKSEEGKKYESSTREFSELIGSKIKMSGYKNDVKSFRPDIENGKIYLELNTPPQPEEKG